MKSPISGILKRFSQVFQRAVDAVALYVIDNLDEDGDVKAVVEQAWLTYKISDVFMDAVRQAVKEACEAGYGQTIPLLPSQLEEAWDASGMTLSKKLHGADKEMRARVVGTIKNQLKQNRHAMRAARNLYDGYRSGQAVVRRQEMPKYLQDIVNFARRSELTAADRAQMLQLVRRARRQVALIGEHGAPNQALRTAYSELLNAVADGSEKALDRAVHVALEEKSRYVAERIARTEAARAWADGFHARYDADDDVAAYKWTLSSRHPHYDICDLYAQANLWGLGPGIFPKDKTPILPVHPHCLCHLSLVYVTEIDMSRQRNQIKDGGDAYLKRQSHAKRCHLLGIDGARAWEQGRVDWRQYMRNWSSIAAKSRLMDTAANDIMKEKVSIGQQLMYQNNGRALFIPKHTIVIPKRVIAGLGSDCNLRIADKLAADYGGMAKEWQKVVGTITSDQYIFDVHWYHHKEVGNVLFKIKSYTERRK